MRRRTRGPSVAGLSPPAELLDRAAEVWHSRELFIRYMADHGWSQHLPPQERFGRDGSAENRRYAAIEGWGMDNGITDDGQTVDWHRLDPLRRAGGSTERTVAR